MTRYLNQLWIKHDSMNERLIIFLFSIMSIGILHAQKNLHKENIAGSYRPDDSFVHPNYKVYHDQDSSSIILYEVNLSELSYEANYDSSSFHAYAKIHYDLYMNYKAKELIDSGSIYLEDSQNHGKDLSTLGSFPIKARFGYSFVARITLTDLNNGNKNVRFVDINKLNRYNRQNFFIKASDDLPMLVDFVNRKETYRIIHRDSNITTAWIKYFEPNLKPARPPMSGGMPNKRIVKSDSIYRIHFTNGVSDEIQFNKQGYYHVMLDSLAQNGLTIFQFTSQYPYINSSMQMVMPVRYLTTHTEFKKIINAYNKKKEVESSG